MTELTRAHERLREELADAEITLPGSPDEVDLLLTELEHAWRPPVFENRSLTYGSFVLPGERSLIKIDNLVELLDLDMPIDQARRFSDGRSSFVVRRADGTRRSSPASDGRSSTKPTSSRSNRRPARRSCSAR